MLRSNVDKRTGIKKTTDKNIICIYEHTHTYARTPVIFFLIGRQIGCDGLWAQLVAFLVGTINMWACIMNSNVWLCLIIGWLLRFWEPIAILRGTDQSCHKHNKIYWNVALLFIHINIFKSFFWLKKILSLLTQQTCECYKLNRIQEANTKKKNNSNY